MQSLVDLAFPPNLGAQPNGKAQHHRQGVIPGQQDHDENKNDEVR